MRLILKNSLLKVGIVNKISDQYQRYGLQLLQNLVIGTGVYMYCTETNWEKF